MITSFESRLIRDAVVAVEEAGRVVARGFTLSALDEKPSGRYDVKLAVDTLSESLLVAELRRAAPGCRVFSEEEVTEETHPDGVTWVVDPLDGTNNFACGIGYLAIGVGLLLNGVIRGAVLHDPLSRTTVATVAGKGLREGSLAFRVPVQLRRIAIERSTVSLVTDYSRGGRLAGYELNRRLGERVRRVTGMWAPGADLMRVCLGQLDAVVSIGADYRDVGAGLLLAEESGAGIVDLRGNELSAAAFHPREPAAFVVASSVELAQEIATVVN